MRRLLFPIAAIALMVIFIGVNVVSGVAFRTARVDLTADKLYTLSPSTHDVLRRISEPIVLRLYFSREAAADYPTVKTYGERIHELLREITEASGGKIVYLEINPEPFSDAEDNAIVQGLTGARTPAGERLYLGLHGTNAVDGNETIPFFVQDRRTFLEYDIMKVIDRLNRIDRPKIAVMSALDLANGPGGLAARINGRSLPNALFSEIEKAFDTTVIESQFTSIDPEVDVLVIVHPPDLGAATLYAIDQFVMRGGRVLAFIDPYSELALSFAREQQLPPDAGLSSTLGKLLPAWGVQFSTDTIAADRQRAQRIVTSADPVRYLDYIAWIALTPEEMADDDPVTANLKSINLASAGLLVPDYEGAPVAALIATSDQSQLIPVDAIRTSPDPAALLSAFDPSGDEMMIGARITKIRDSAFADGPPPELADVLGEEITKLPPHLAEAVGETAIILVADTDLFDDTFWVRSTIVQDKRITVPDAGNGNFVINAIDNLAGEGSLATLRSRGLRERPFTLFAEMRRNADAKVLAEEEALRARLKEAQARLAELENTDAASLNAAQAAEAQNFRRDELLAEKALREVRGTLNQDIEKLQSQVRTLNVIAVPALIAVLFILLPRLFGLFRRPATVRVREPEV